MLVVYRGPGDGVELDGIHVTKDEPVELTLEQIGRVVASDPAAVVEPAPEQPKKRRD